MAEAIFISFEDVEHKIDIEDANNEDLKDLFGLNFDVKFLKEKETDKSVPLKKIDKLKPGFRYIIQKPKTPKTSKAVTARQELEPWLSNNSELIQNALVVSQAVYEQSTMDYLNENMMNHGLKSILRSQHGDLHFLLAEEEEHGRLYIAFRGTEDFKDISEDLRVYQRAATSGLFELCSKNFLIILL